MPIDPWLPFAHILPDGSRSRLAIHEGNGWQILQVDGGQRVLITNDELAAKWVTAGILDEGALMPFQFGPRSLNCIVGGDKRVVAPVADAAAPSTINEALAFALAFKATRAIDAAVPLHDAVYVERYSRLLPTYSLEPRLDDELIVGRWLTGGASISVRSFRRLHQVLAWLQEDHLRRVVEAAGFADAEADAIKPEATPYRDGEARPFELPGRPELASFFNEHIVDVLQNRDRYKALGIGFPSAVVLHGPPGTGKTYAVERLIEFLGWPDFSIDASSVASPYIHETSRKVAEVFEKAIESAPSVLVIDEMEAFLADRDMGSGHHRVEEVAEFLRRIPEAAKSEVLIIAVTNRVDMIDPAILRRGRFDHIIKVDYAGAEEVQALLSKLLADLPASDDIDISEYANKLADRPLSDVAFVVREAARLAAREGKNELDNESMEAALAGSPERRPEGELQRRIGFM